MSRYRPPTTPGSKYITPEGAQRLKTELDSLWLIERPRVTQAVAEAAAQGDRSENAEYTYGKKRLREIDSRVRFLRKRLEGMKVVDTTPGDPARVFFGAWVQVEDETGSIHWHRIVGPDEFDADKAYVSMDSPLGKALLGKRIGAESLVQIPSGTRLLTILAVHYGQPPR
jgi:transcription elongation factor GreB